MDSAFTTGNAGRLPGFCANASVVGLILDSASTIETLRFPSSVPWTSTPLPTYDPAWLSLASSQKTRLNRCESAAAVALAAPEARAPALGNMYRFPWLRPF
jgi:hypothetical protein